MNEKGPEFVGDGQDDMPMVAVEEFFGHRLGPDVGMFFAATGAEFAFTAKRDGFCFTAMRADVGGKAAVFGAAGEHFFGFMEDMLGKLVRVELFKKDPIIITSENGFKGKVFAHDSRDYIRKSLGFENKKS